MLNNTPLPYWKRAVMYATVSIPTLLLSLVMDSRPLQFDVFLSLVCYILAFFFCVERLSHQPVTAFFAVQFLMLWRKIEDELPIDQDDLFVVCFLLISITVAYEAFGPATEATEQINWNFAFLAVGYLALIVSSKVFEQNRFPGLSSFALFTVAELFLGLIFNLFVPVEYRVSLLIFGAALIIVVMLLNVKFSAQEIRDGLQILAGMVKHGGMARYWLAAGGILPTQQELNARWQFIALSFLAVFLFASPKGILDAKYDAKYTTVQTCFDLASIVPLVQLPVRPTLFALYLYFWGRLAHLVFPILDHRAVRIPEINDLLG
jgi:hypothetical protein